MDLQLEAIISEWSSNEDIWLECQENLSEAGESEENVEENNRKDDVEDTGEVEEKARHFLDPIPQDANLEGKETQKQDNDGAYEPIEATPHHPAEVDNDSEFGTGKAEESRENDEEGIQEKPVENREVEKEARDFPDDPLAPQDLEGEETQKTGEETEAKEPIATTSRPQVDPQETDVEEEVTQQDNDAANEPIEATPHPPAEVDDDLEFEVVQTNRGKPQLLLKGYTYHVNKMVSKTIHITENKGKSFCTVHYR